MLARSNEWQFTYDLSREIGQWPHQLNNHDRIRFAKWCQFYIRLQENYDEDERPDDRMMMYDVLVDDFLRREKAKRQKEKLESRKGKGGLNISTSNKSVGRNLNSGDVYSG